MSLSVKFWGVRGSLPSALMPEELSHHIEKVIYDFLDSGGRSKEDVSSFLRKKGLTNIAGHGTATSCVEVMSERGHLIIDGGSGIRNLGLDILKRAEKERYQKIHIYMTHFHWDHVIGLPFFVPHFIPGVEIHYYAVQPELEKLVRGIFMKPYFPVPFEALKAKIHFHKLEPRKPIVIDDITMTPYMLDHPDPCWGLKVQSGSKAYAHCVDTEGTRVTSLDLGEDLPLYQGIDLMYFDAQYTLPELAEKANWGHSAAQVGLDIAIREKIPHVLFAHHDPGAGIAQIEELKRQTRDYQNARSEFAKNKDEELFSVQWDFVAEGFEVKL